MSNNLSADSTIREIFDFIRADEPDAVQVVPVVISKPDSDCARFMILIQGAHETADIILANLMTAIKSMHDMAEQQKAAAPPKDSKLRLVNGSDKPSVS